MSQYGRPHGKSPKSKIHSKVKIDIPGDRPLEIDATIKGPKSEVEKLAEDMGLPSD